MIPSKEFALVMAFYDGSYRYNKGVSPPKRARSSNERSHDQRALLSRESRDIDLYIRLDNLDRIISLMTSLGYHRGEYPIGKVADRGADEAADVTS